MTRRFDEVVAALVSVLAGVVLGAWVVIQFFAGIGYFLTCLVGIGPLGKWSNFLVGVVAGFVIICIDAATEAPTKSRVRRLA